MTDAPLSNDAARADVWLWRARFFKTRSLAAKFVDEGRIRLTRAGAESRIDKPSRTLKPGEVLVFGDHAAQQFLLAAEMRIERLLGATGARGDRVHAHAEPLLGHELAHGLVDAGATLIGRGWGGGGAHRG